ncbi:aldo/keto reductase [Mesorhizobium sp. B2-3-10]|uniref:aldo/keto reductase n=1 Tax=Mesorhizobium sp. B2-3-10 TaxID=2589954 RepID=UPI001FEDECF9|nr:aldo/keto reductase [Mesorhizobium sp. B2-3-10]
MSHDSRIALTRDGMSLSRLVFGARRLLDGPVRPDADQVARLIGNAVDLGLTSFDHADIYGSYEVEAAFGAGLARWQGRREAIELISKCDIVLATNQIEMPMFNTSARTMRNKQKNILAS